MTDVVLRIYSGSGASWGQTLDYEITDILDYVVTDDSGYAVDTAWFKLEDVGKVYADGIDPDYDTNVQIYRVYNKGDGKLISSGLITKVVEKGNTTELTGEGMNSLFKRRVVTDYGLTGDGSLKFTDVLINATSGLIQGSTSGLLPSSDYKAFDLSTHVVAGAVAIPTGYELKYDNISLYDVVVDVCKKTVGAGGRSYDCYLFEMDDDDETLKPTLSTASTKYKMCLYLKEKGSTASGVTFDGGSVDLGDVRWSNQKGGESYFNKVIVRGAFQEVNQCPINKVFWSNFDHSSDGGWDTTNATAVYSSDETGLSGSAYCMRWDVDNGVDESHIIIDLDDNSMYSIGGVTYCPSSLFTSSKGYRINRSKNQYLSFNILFDATTSLMFDAESWNFQVYIKVLNTASSPLEYTFVQLVPPIYTLNMDSGGSSTGWIKFDVSLDEYWKRCAGITPDSGWFISAIGFVIGSGSDTTDNGCDIWVDEVYFYERDYQVEGEATKGGVSSNLKELLIELPELQNDDLCEKIATEALKEQDQLHNSGTIPVLGPFRVSDLRAGNTIEIAIDSLGLDVRSGASGAEKFEVEKIVYTPNRQTLSIGKNFSMDEMAENMKARAIRSFNRLR